MKVYLDDFYNANDRNRDFSIKYQVSQKKYTHLMSHNTTSVTSILQIRLGSDS